MCTCARAINRACNTGVTVTGKAGKTVKFVSPTPMKSAIYENMMTRPFLGALTSNIFDMPDKQTTYVLVFIIEIYSNA